MSGTAAFDVHAARYDEWFERHPGVYQSELMALRAFLPVAGFGLEVGVGGARFAAPLGIAVGLDPSMAMLRHAWQRGVEVVTGRAEALPFRAECFDSVLVVTTLCFVDSPARMLCEASRVLKPQGRLVVGFIDRDSPIGRGYLAHQAESVFYRDARFHSAVDVQQLLQETDFRILGWGQTLGASLQETVAVEAVEGGYGRGAFVVVAAEKGTGRPGPGEA
jgi:ubiquinone/menaquinone biosynthesis C-methylase UbiE